MYPRLVQTGFGYPPPEIEATHESLAGIGVVELTTHPLHVVPALQYGSAV
jgi:hypothetical protein